MKTKDDMLKVIKKWYSDIADICEKHDLVVVMRDNHHLTMQEKTSRRK